MFALNPLFQLLTQVKNPNPRIALIGPIIIDKKSSGGEGEKLYQALKAEGYTIYKRSVHRNKLLRLISTVWFLLSRARSYDTVVMMIFSGRAFILEYIVLIICNLLGKTKIGVLHGGALHEFQKTYPNMVGYLYNKCQHLLTPSNFLKQYFQGKGWQVGYMPNFINPAYFPNNWENPQEKKLLWVRAFHDIYKPEMAIQCIADLRQKYPDISLTMVGPDLGTLSHCRKLIHKLKLEEHITITGAVPNTTLNSFYKSHMAFLTTTSFESFGVALIEAASTGIPMVSTRVGEIPYMWEENAEMLMATDGDQENFNQKVEQIITDQHLRTALSEHAFRKARIYTWDEVKLKWNTILKHNQCVA